MTATPIIVGLDVATRCGFCHGDGRVVPTAGHYEGLGAGDDLAPYFRAFRNWLVGMLTEQMRRAEASGTRVVVIFEAPVFPKPFLKTIPGRKPQIIQHASIKDRRRLYGLVSIVELVCGDLGISCFEASVGELKKELAGRGDADKADMVRAARRMGVAISKLPNGDDVHDEADAVAAWKIGIRYYARQHLERWDRALYSSAGALL